MWAWPELGPLCAALGLEMLEKAHLRSRAPSHLPPLLA